MQISMSVNPKQLQDRDRCPTAEREKSEIFRKSTNAAPRSKPTRNKVSFNTLAFVRETLHVSNYSQEEKRKVWYQKCEMNHIRSEMVATVRLMLRGGYEDDNEEHCMRGLEFRSRAGDSKRSENKLVALEAVLDEQDTQYDGGIINAKAISSVYRRVSLQCRNEANVRGTRDEIEVYGRLRTGCNVDEFSASGPKKRPTPGKHVQYLLRKCTGSRNLR
jgi:hypothetical protein